MTLQHIKPTREHVRHGIKVGLACVLALIVSGSIGVPYAYWAVITTVIVMQMHVADSIRMSFYRFSGTAIGAFIGIVAILIFPPTQPYTALAVFLTTGLCAYLTRYNARYRMAAITVAIVFLTSMGEENRISFTLFRVLEIGIGVVCAFTVSVLVWPSRIGDNLRQRLQEQCEQAALHYEHLMSSFLARQQKVDPDMFFELARAVQENRALFLKVVSHERRFYRTDVRLLSLQINGLAMTLERMQSMPRLLNEVEGEGFDIIMAPELEELTRTTCDALRALGAGVPYDNKALAAAVVTAEERLTQIRKEGATRRFDVRRLLQVFGFINTSQHIGEFLLDVLNRPEYPTDGNENGQEARFTGKP